MSIVRPLPIEADIISQPQSERRCCDRCNDPDTKVEQHSMPGDFDEGGASLRRPSGVNCPNCHAEVEICELQSIQFLGCPECKGMAFQNQVFGTLIQHLRRSCQLPPVIPEPMDVNALKVRRPCPTCDGMLETHSYGGPGNAVIDSCFACGIVFFDRGELTKLVRAPGR